MANRHAHLLAACAAVLFVAAPAAARPGDRHHHAPAPLPERSTVTVHRGVHGAVGARYAEAGAPWFGGGEGDAWIGYREADYGREDDAAIFAQRYGCARPIWNAKSNRYMPACN